MVRPCVAVYRTTYPINLPLSRHQSSIWRQRLHENACCCFEQILEVTCYKTVAILPLTSHLTNSSCRCCSHTYIYVHIYIYIYIHTHTHTYIYIYIYIQDEVVWVSLYANALKKDELISSPLTMGK